MLRAICPGNLADVSSWMDFVADCDAFGRAVLTNIVGMGHSIGAGLVIEIIQPDSLNILFY